MSDDPKPARKQKAAARRPSEPKPSTRKGPGSKPRAKTSPAARSPGARRDAAPGSPCEEARAILGRLRAPASDGLRDAGLAGELLAHGGAAVVPVLVEALSDDNVAVRFAAAIALERMGPSAADALPAIVDRLADDDPESETDGSERAALARALATIGTERVGAHLAALGERSPAAHARVLEALREGLSSGPRRSFYTVRGVGGEDEEARTDDAGEG
ncbi:HEAT repeat domain-containing protein [Planctomycetota bacterium]